MKEQDKNWHDETKLWTTKKRKRRKSKWKEWYVSTRVKVWTLRVRKGKQNVINNWKMMINESSRRQKPITSYGVRYRVYLEFKKSGHWSRSIDPCANLEIKHSSLLAKILIAFFLREQRIFMTLFLIYLWELFFYGKFFRTLITFFHDKRLQAMLQL